VTVIALDTGNYVVVAFVSNNVVFFRANQLCTQRRSETDDLSIALHMAIAEGISFACCDFLAQSILVRTTADSAY
jgi:hypothetical protein